MYELASPSAATLTNSVSMSFRKKSNALPGPFSNILPRRVLGNPSIDVQAKRELSAGAVSSAGAVARADVTRVGWSVRGKCTVGGENPTMAEAWSRESSGFATILIYQSSCDYLFEAQL